MDGVPNARSKDPQDLWDCRQAAAGAYRRSIGTMVLSGASGRGGGTGFPPMTKAGLARLSARSDGLDNVDSGPDRGSYIQMRGIEQVCIFRLSQGGYGPARIAL